MRVKLFIYVITLFLLSFNSVSCKSMAPRAVEDTDVGLGSWLLVVIILGI